MIQKVPRSHKDPQTIFFGTSRQELVKSVELTKLLFRELIAMRNRKFDNEARIVMAIYAGQVLVFALGALYAL
jgi:gentisate 1,2-dioxygenase